LISVVIPHLNRPEALEACLGSLDVQSLARDFFEIIIVDNGSVSIPENIVLPIIPARDCCVNYMGDPAPRAIPVFGPRPVISLPSSMSVVARIVPPMRTCDAHPTTSNRSGVDSFLSECPAFRSSHPAEAFRHHKRL